VHNRDNVYNLSIICEQQKVWMSIFAQLSQMPYGSDRSSHAWFFATDFQRSSHCLSFTCFHRHSFEGWDNCSLSSHRGFTSEALAAFAWTASSLQLVWMHLAVSEPLHIVLFAHISLLELPPLPTNTKWRQVKCQSLIKITCLQQNPGLKLPLHRCSHVWCHHTSVLHVSWSWGFLYSGPVTLKQVAYQSRRGQARRTCSARWSLIQCACAVQHYFAVWLLPFGPGGAHLRRSTASWSHLCRDLASESTAQCLPVTSREAGIISLALQNKWWGVNPTPAVFSKAKKSHCESWTQVPGSHTSTDVEPPEQVLLPGQVLLPQHWFHVLCALGGWQDGLAFLSNDETGMHTPGQSVFHPQMGMDISV